MRISVIVAHPDPTSLNHAIATAACEAVATNGHACYYHDLYTEGFDPILPAYEIPRDVALPALIAQHCREISLADGLVIVHPNWWGQPPAMLKGWIDRVIRPGVAYEFIEKDQGDGVPVGLLKVKTALILNTSNTPTERELAVFGDPLERIWADCVLGLCGVQDVRRHMFNVVVTSTLPERHSWIKKASDLVSDAFPESTP